MNGSELIGLMNDITGSLYSSRVGDFGLSFDYQNFTDMESSQTEYVNSDNSDQFFIMGFSEWGGTSGGSSGVIAE
jgi:hypothetical protein